MVVVKSLIGSRKRSCTLSHILNVVKLFVSDCFLLTFDNICKTKSTFNIEKGGMEMLRRGGGG